MRSDEVVANLAVDQRDRVQRMLTLLHRQAVYSVQMQGRVESRQKEDGSPVTVVDLLHQSQVQELLATHFPRDGLLCEEPRSLQEAVLEEAIEISRRIYGLPLGDRVVTLPREGDVVWVLDPIDGTKGFLGGRYFALAVGYFVHGEPFFGAIAVPASSVEKPLAIDARMAFAIRGEGAWIAKVVEGAEAEWERLRSEPWEGPKMRIAVSLAHGGPLVERLEAMQGLEVVRLDSQAKYLAVAVGEIDAYLRSARDDGHPDVVWDHMPAALVASEAGCIVSHFDGEPVEFEPTEAIGFHGGVVCCRCSAKNELRTALQTLTDRI